MNSLTWPQVPWLARIIAWHPLRTPRKAIVEAVVGQKSNPDQWLTVPEMLARGMEITPEGPNSTPEDGDLAANLEALYGKKYERGSQVVEELRESLKGFNNAYGLGQKE